MDPSLKQEKTLKREENMSYEGFCQDIYEYMFCEEEIRGLSEEYRPIDPYANFDSLEDYENKVYRL